MESISHLLLAENAVELSPDQPFTYASGIKSPIYCDNRQLITSPSVRARVIESFKEALLNDGHKDVMIAATATAGIPWGAWVASELDAPFVYVRSEKKSHGLGKQIEGQLNSSLPVVVIEDLISSGGSSRHVIDVLQKEGIEVVGLYSIFTYDLKKAKQVFQGLDFEPISLAHLQDLIDVAVREYNLSIADKNKILSWQDSPEGWEA